MREFRTLFISMFFAWFGIMWRDVLKKIGVLAGAERSKQNNNKYFVEVNETVYTSWMFYNHFASLVFIYFLCAVRFSRQRLLETMLFFPLKNSVRNVYQHTFKNRTSNRRKVLYSSVRANERKLHVLQCWKCEPTVTTHDGTLTQYYYSTIIDVCGTMIFEKKFSTDDNVLRVWREIYL